MQVQISDYFKEAYPSFDIGIRLAVARFIDHIENYGLKGLQGRNKSSADLTDTTKKALSELNLLKNIVFDLSFGGAVLYSANQWRFNFRICFALFLL